MKNYTVGFIFDSSREKVLLTHKLRPDWQVGKLNGPGGKIEENETSSACIVREIKEETGLRTDASDWILFAKIQGRDHSVDFYTLVYRGSPTDIAQMTDEKIEWFDVAKLPDTVLSNLTWLIPLAKDKYVSEKLDIVLIKER